MRIFYLSFCDSTKPKGTQFLGATVIAAAGPSSALERSHELKINPGGEVAIAELLDFRSIDELPKEAAIYLDKFVPAEVVKASPFRRL